MSTVVSVYIVKNNCLHLSTLFSKESIEFGNCYAHIRLKTVIWPIFNIENETHYHGGLINFSQSCFLCSGQLVVNLLMLQVKIRNT